MPVRLPEIPPAPPGDVLYTSRWNAALRQPMPISPPWLGAEEAEERWQTRTRAGELSIVDASVRDPDGRPRPGWSIGVGFTGVRVRFYTRGGGSIWRSVDYDDRDGRLWRWTTTEYVHPDDERFYRQDQATRIAIAKLEPDGTGYVDFNDKSKATVDRARLTDAPVAGFWLDWPEFGHWEDLANPDYGLGDDPGSTLGGRPQ